MYFITSKGHIKASYGFITIHVNVKGIKLFEKCAGEMNMEGLYGKSCKFNLDHDNEFILWIMLIYVHNFKCFTH